MMDKMHSETRADQPSSEVGVPSGISNWSAIGDPGDFLPGCSLPIHARETDAKYHFAFCTHDPWQTTKLTNSQQKRLLADIRPVLDGLHSLHQKRLFYGRISNRTFCC